jgi:hypothetical protein
MAAMWFNKEVTIEERQKETCVATKTIPFMASGLQFSNFYPCRCRLSIGLEALLENDKLRVAELQT